MSDVVVDPDVFEEDAEGVWQAAADVMANIMSSLPQLSAFDFGAAPGGLEMSSLYDEARLALLDYVQGGRHEFLRFEHLLLESALEYVRAQDDSTADIERIEREMRQDRTPR